MRGWDHGGGFSVDASVRVEASDRAGLERLLRYCARGPLALERLARDPDDPERLFYHLPKPTADGRVALTLTPLELLSRLAALIPPPRVHRHRYAGVLAPNSPWRAAVTAGAEAGAETERVAPPSPPAHPLDASATPVHRSPARSLGRRCCWRASTRPFRWFAPCAGRRCVGSPSSPTAPRSPGSWSTSASRPAPPTRIPCAGAAGVGGDARPDPGLRPDRPGARARLRV
jgi:hypothetical protein